MLPKKSALHRDLAGVYWKKQHYAEAERHYKIVVADEPTDVQAVYRLGLDIFNTGTLYAESVAEFEKVIELDTGHVGAYEVDWVLHIRNLGIFLRRSERLKRCCSWNRTTRNASEMLKQLRERTIRWTHHCDILDVQIGRTEGW